jgi:hypothetical protein
MPIELRENTVADGRTFTRIASAQQLRDYSDALQKDKDFFGTGLYVSCFI